MTSDVATYALELRLPPKLIVYERKPEALNDLYGYLQTDACETTYARLTPERLLLGEGPDTDNVQASYDAGVLHLTIPLTQQAHPRRVTISRREGGQRVIEAGGEGEQLTCESPLRRRLPSVTSEVGASVHRRADVRPEQTYAAPVLAMAPCARDQELL